jgi:2-hydroxychromene-2-carboxylate isomerase
MPVIDFYYDFSSPNAYFAAFLLPPIAERHGASIEWKPIFLGGLFKELGVSSKPGMSSPAKAKDSMRDQERWSAKHDIPFRFASRFPLNTVKPLRVALALGSDGGDLRAYTQAVYRAYWADDRDVSDDAELQGICDALGLDGASLVARASDPAIKAALKDATDEAMRREVFGVPTFIVGGELFFGKDRLDFVEDALTA